MTKIKKVALTQTEIDLLPEMASRLYCKTKGYEPLFNGQYSEMDDDEFLDHLFDCTTDNIANHINMGVKPFENEPIRLTLALLVGYTKKGERND